MLLTETLPQTIKNINTESEVSVIILLYKNAGFGGLKPFDIEIYGKKMWKYIEMACGDLPVKTTTCTAETNVFELIRPMLTNSKYTLVLYSDTPLVQSSTIRQVIDYAKMRDVNVMTLKRGYLFNTNYLRHAESIQGGLEYLDNAQDFVIVSDAKQLERVNRVIKNRILDFHLSSGIIIKDRQTTFIDADVIIENGVVIEGCNVLKGQSFIGKNTVLKSFNHIENSIIKENCVVGCAYIKNSKIESGQTLEAFAKIIG